MTTLLAKANSFLEHACGNPLRYVLKAPSEPVVLFLSFSGLDFTLKPDFNNPVSKLLKCRSKQLLRLFSFCQLTLARIYNLIIPKRKEAGQFLCQLKQAVPLP